MNQKLGKKLGEGGCSEIFEWEDAKIIKLAKPNTDLASLKRELELTRLAWESGLSVAKPFVLTEIDNRPGIIFERIEGESILQRFMRNMAASVNNDIANELGIRMTARALYEIHQKPVTTSVSLRHRLKHAINGTSYLSELEKEAVLIKLNQLPEKQAFCHGDPNPGNMLITPEGKTLVIDWMDASNGNPESDLAEYIIMIRYSILPPQLPEAALCYFDSIRELIIQIFMDEYTRLSGLTYMEVEPWIVPVAARKLSADAISHDEKGLLVREIRNRL